MSNSLASLSHATLTTSQLFRNGGGIEQLLGHNLLLAYDGHQEMGPILSCEGRTYAGVTLDEDLQQALRLPTRAEDFGTIDTLLSSIADLLASYGVDPTISWQIAAFALGTWVAECLPGIPLLNLWGPPGTDSLLLELLRCLCRRPVGMLTPSLRELAKLPADLCPTLFLTTPKPAALAELVAAASQSGVGVFHGGGFRRVNCAIVVYSAEPISCTALDIPLITSAAYYRRITRAEAEAISDQFQPRLLGYRLKQHLQAAQSQYDCPQFGPTTRQLARILGAALEGDAVSQTRLVAVLKSADEQNQVEQSQSPTAVVLEALLTLTHEKKGWAQIGDIANLTNAILQARGDRATLSARAVGSLVRNKLGLDSVRSGFGWRVKLTTQAHQDIHRLAGIYGVLSMGDPVVDCQLCKLHGTVSSPEDVGEEQRSQSS